MIVVLTNQAVPFARIIMPKPLTYYIGNRKDNVIAIELQPFIDKMPDAVKLCVAFSTLHLMLLPNEPCPIAPQLHTEMTMINELSSSGKVELVRALMEQVKT